MLTATILVRSHLQRYLLEHGISGAELARRIGVSSQRAGQLIWAKRRPSPETRARICAALGATEAELWPDEVRGA